MKKLTLAALLFVALLISASTHKQASSKLILYAHQSLRGDAVFSRIVPNNNYGLLEDIHLYAWTQQDILNINRVALDFNTTEIPHNKIIKHAYLNLYFNPTSKYDKGLPGDGNSGHMRFMVMRIVGDWREQTVTWALQPDVDATTKAIFKKKKDTRANYLKLDVTTVVQNMINKPAEERFGLMLRLTEERPYNVYFFASGNHPDEKLRPSLEIVY